MKKTLLKNNTAVLAFLFLLFSSFYFKGISFADIPSRVDKTALELELASRLESMIEKVIGKEKCLVKVSLTLAESSEKEAPLAVQSSLKDLPTVIFSENKNKPPQIAERSGAATIKSISVVVYLDKGIAQEKIELVKSNAPKWLELNFSRGDSLKIEQITLKSAEETTSPKEGFFSKKNLGLIIGLTIAFMAGIGLILFLFLPLRKFAKEMSKTKVFDGKPVPDFEALLNNFKESLSGNAPAQNIDTLLEDIKEILSKSPASNIDGFLEEIKETLEKMAKTQAALPAGGGYAPVAGQPAQAAPMNPAVGQEFLSALKEAITPATIAAAGGGGGGGGGGMSPEVVEALRKIEELMRKQLEATATGSKALDEPFKYLNTLSLKEISLLIEGEDVQTASIVLAHIDPSKAGTILAGLPDQQRLEISLAMVNLVETEEVGSQIREFLQRKIPAVKLRSDFSPVAGNKTLLNILNSVPYNMTLSILENIEKRNPEVAKAIKKEMFVFEDIAAVADDAVGEILKSVDIHQLALALSVSSAQVREKFYKNTPEAIVNKLKEDVESLSPVATEGEPKKISTFEDIVNLDTRAIQHILGHTDKASLKIALKGTSEEVRNKFYATMTERGAAMLKEDIEVMSPIPRPLAEESQKKILLRIHEIENERFVAVQDILGKIRELELSGRVKLKT